MTILLMTYVLQIYPIDSAKSIYQRNCLSTQPGKTPTLPKIQFFKRRMYRGMLDKLFANTPSSPPPSPVEHGADVSSWKGLGVSMTRSAVINAVFFSVFELIKKRINRLEIEEHTEHTEA
jgi:solute carrier family 25 (mitochondrial carnitine/acylcarnitine transporter), member 20/29